MKFLLLLFTIFSFSASAVELINPWKGGSQGVELNQILIAYLEKNQISVRTIDVDHCRIVPTVWKQYKSPITISWSDAKECVSPTASNIALFSQAGQVFCSLKDLNLAKKSLKIGWQASAPLTGLYEAFEKKYGQLQKVPYSNSGQQIQGVIAGEIDIALLGQGSALTSPLHCFLATVSLPGINTFEFPEKEQYFSLLAVIYEDSTIKSLMNSFAKLPEVVAWREKRLLTYPQITDEKRYFLSNTFDRR
jgi:hypothetical protein